MPFVLPDPPFLQLYESELALVLVSVVLCLRLGLVVVLVGSVLGLGLVLAEQVVLSPKWVRLPIPLDIGLVPTSFPQLVSISIRAILLLALTS